MDPEEIVKNCQFVPLSAIHKAIDFIETPKENVRFSHHCKRDLLKLQTNLTIGNVSKRHKILKDKYHIALHKAIYSHDWNKLLYLLKKSPVWNHPANSLQGYTHYIRALTILMMFHPSAQAMGMLQDYIHMVCSCRTDEEKKALMKLILALPEKIVEQKGLYPYQKRFIND